MAFSLSNLFKKDGDKKTEKVKKDKKDMTFKEKVVENVKLFFSAYLIAFVIRLFLIEAYQIPSQSMVPNLKVKDTLMVQKLSYGAVLPIVHWKLPGFSHPRRNDIIVFITPEWKSPGVGKELVSLLTLSIITSTIPSTSRRIS
jgi:signal peptidase I